MMGSTGQPSDRSGNQAGDQASNLVEPDWLAENLHRDDVLAVGCSLEGFALGHIPGAIFPFHAWLKDESDPTAIVPQQVFAEVLGVLGIDESTAVVAYDDFDNSYACRLWWVARYYGLHNIKVLNGGWHRWVLEQRELTDEVADRKPTIVELRPDPSQISQLAEIVAGLEVGTDVGPDAGGEGGSMIVDLRRPLFWAGHDDNPFGNKRQGRIPGALNVDTALLIDPETRAFLAPEAIASILTDGGLRPTDRSILYCQAGPRSALAVFVLEELGWAPGRLYEGSMAEWANDDDVPLVIDE